MKIQDYAFGRITIDGTTYTSDVILHADRVDASWWRKTGHRLQPADLSDVLQERPDVLIIGTGSYGLMKVPKKTLAALAEQGIDVQVKRTPAAVQLFNDAPENKKVIAALHLSC